MINLIGNCSVLHVYMEKNGVADCLANLSYNFDLGLCVFDYARVCTVSKNLDDLLAVPKSRKTRMVCLNHYE